LIHLAGEMKGDALYWFLASILNNLVWGGELINQQDLPDEYPVVFVSNHAAALGAIAVPCSLPLRVYPWVVNDMMDFSKAPEYLRKDFIEPQLHISPQYSLKIAALLSKISVRLLRALDCIPVWKSEAVAETYRLSVQALAQGKNLLIFPEDPSQKMNELYQMTPFYKGFTRLGEMYYKQTGKTLRFYPLAVHPVARKIKIGMQVSYNPYNEPVRERLRIKNVLESAIHNLYLDIVMESYSGVLLPH
jgi:hypothetical protein